jgi:hypothetical protein
MVSACISKIKVVVARYKEDLSWLSQIRDLCVIYNKSPENPLMDFEHSIPLVNVGREADTYLKHIIRTYPYFSDYVVFTQGNIADHVREVAGFVRHVKEIDDGMLTNVPDYEGLNQFGGQQGWGTISNFQDNAHAGLPIKDWWFAMYDEAPNNNEIRCNYCGIFLVSKKNILYHTLEFYEKLHAMCKEDPIYSPYVLERLWTTIFDGQTPSKL